MSFPSALKTGLASLGLGCTILYISAEIGRLSGYPSDADDYDAKKAFQLSFVTALVNATFSAKIADLVDRHFPEAEKEREEYQELAPTLPYIGGSWTTLITLSVQKSSPLATRACMAAGFLSSVALRLITKPQIRSRMIESLQSLNIP